MANIGSSDLDVFPLNLGGNVFGWTADEAASAAVLDAYTEAGGNFVDTADVYSAWAPGNSGGESERVLGGWMAARGNRSQVVVATKVGSHPERKGLRAENILAAADDSLQRLGTDYIDLYYVHRDDDHDIPVEEFLGAFGQLVEAGKVRYIAASNMTPERLEASFAAAEADAGLPRFVALQPNYNLVDRADYESTYPEVVAKHNLGVLPYWSLASGFLTGKYRDGATVHSQRASGASKHLNDRGRKVLAALDHVAEGHGVPVAAVALAWLKAQPGIVAPIASARTVEQLADLLPVATLELSADELAALTAASE
ncbi:aldo/keto reductase [Actinokineospora bangkokensis]|uniref:Alcohol dehydrogenase n=1 Tax=Actinokineospora bangkokensis TaxID=1193682 RepID=A0A1Q9LFV7_9PSEU|nr:aldo/keto reductase [Actinokineospora bangkokensis]OLR90921.1 alcohol dehydrogenase [Actinokineospora bangkokensis]